MVRRSQDTATPDLFQVPEPPPLAEGSLNFVHELRSLLSQVLKDCTHSRWQVAARMSELLGHELSKYQLDAWTAESREPWRFPLEYLFAFEVACDTTAVTEWLVRRRGGHVLFGPEALTAELGRLQRQKDATDRRIKAVRKAMEERT